ncbi:hypothetical protein [Xanthomonas phaseoli]|uniref:hypothetical protein n=1 Tax=Xanthomonas phaseoli TaxID=1985254 RepID=UPI000A8418A5|nr:hypothetical protein [Xanthomonas phaseoli]MBO9789772.1 hypothetical protein [Xanthomonas phaseoli pv. dieffenbachiae]MBO9834616.1 hypothetical protein [Xanthomonas phaseoli pv. dieffenbachiae]MBO9840076.1 hypothetical protein [Xanthomonas phaseoli pv. dieffenbachiae]MBO9854653.1 hypothetical protein [Xanthomonas phaseoli pv. dieffenbachiae]MBO9862916.1 hypothetical protein [Xanthomonas phaseoli pv. dieffenbachiae]
MDMSRFKERLWPVCLFLTFLFFLQVHYFRFLPPTNALIDLTFVVACVAAAMFFSLLLWANATGRLQRQIEAHGAGSVMFRWSLLGIVIAMLGWSLILRLGPWVWTEVFGDVYSEDVLIRSASGSLLCPHAVTVDPMPRGAPQRLCLLAGEVPDLGDGYVQAVIEGKRSAAGSTVRNLHLNATHQ